MGSPAGPANIRAVARESFPSINTGTTIFGVEIYVFASALHPKQIELSVQRNLLTISGEDSSVQPRNTSTYLKERHVCQFRRVLSLPEDIDPDSASGQYSNGILQVSLKPRTESHPRKVQVNT